MNNDIEISKEELDTAVKEYLERRGIIFNVDAIYYITDHNGEIKKVIISKEENNNEM